MSDRQKEFAKQLAAVRQTTRHLITSVLLDQWPNIPAVADFGIDSQKHYEALYFPIRAQEILPQALDDALGHGGKLTALTRESASNPHKDVEFHTSWDVALGRDLQAGLAKEKEAFQKILDGKTETPAVEKEKDTGIER
jgi:hypothetical protein